MPQLSHPFTAIDVIDLAVSILESGPLPGDNCGDYFPYCALAMAKSRLDDKHDTGASIMDALLNFNAALPSDKPVRPENPKLFADLTFFGFVLMLDPWTSPSSDMPV
jgi:hypothetical protein